jgi:hypothetical protein
MNAPAWPSAAAREGGACVEASPVVLTVSEDGMGV